MSYPSSNRDSIIVADAGPLIALAKVGQLSLPVSIFKECLVTQSVLDECLVKPEREDARQIQKAVDEAIIKIAPDPKIRPAFQILDRGEQTALELALQLKATVLLDEKRGRQFAKANSVPLLGVLGLLLLAKNLGKLQSVKPVLFNLNEQGYYVSSQLFSKALSLAGE